MLTTAPESTPADWQSHLREKSSLQATHKLLKTEGGDRFRAAEAIQHAQDRTASGVTQSLKLAEKLARTLQRPPEIMFVPTSKERSVATTANRKSILASFGELQSKTELLSQLNKEKPLVVKDIDRSEPTPISRSVEKSTVQSNPLRSSHLWSGKSFDMYKRMQEFVDTTRGFPSYELLSMYSKGDAMGVVDTYYPSQLRDSIEHCCNDWVYFKSRFEVAKNRYIQTEIEPLVLMLSSRPGMRKPHENAGGVGGSASIAPLRAVLKAVQVQKRTPAPDPDGVNLPRGEESTAKNHQHHTADGGDTTSTLHVRPLFTAGDLMLALFELLDPSLFTRGCLPLKEATSSWSPLVHYFRVVYRVGKPNKWYYLAPSKRLQTHNEDLSPYLCPYICKPAFEPRPLPASMETVEMKVWVSNFVRSYKLLNDIGGGSSEASTPRLNTLPKLGVGSLQSLTVDVQLIRHIEDAYLHWSQVSRPSKAELRAQEQERVNIFDDEFDAMFDGDVEKLVRGGKNYEVKFRLVHVVDVSLVQKLNPVDAALGPGVSGFKTPRRAPETSSKASHHQNRSSPDSPIHAADKQRGGSPSRGKTETKGAPSESMGDTDLPFQVNKRNIVDEIPKFDVHISNMETAGSPLPHDEGGEDEEPTEDEEEDMDEHEGRSGPSQGEGEVAHIGQIKSSDHAPERKKNDPLNFKIVRQYSNGASEVDAFLKRCRDMSVLFNKTKTDNYRRGRADVSHLPDEEVDGGSEEDADGGDESPSSDVSSEHDPMELLSKGVRSGAADTHYKRSKMRRALLMREKTLREEEEQRKKELMLLMELDSLRRNRRATATPAESKKKKKRRDSALYMYATDEVQPPLQFLESKRKTMYISAMAKDDKPPPAEVSMEESDIEADNDTQDSETEDAEELTASQTVAGIMTKRKTRKRAGKMTTIASKRPPRTTLSSVGAGPSRKAQNGVVDKSGQYNNSEDEVNINTTTIVKDADKESAIAVQPPIEGEKESTPSRPTKRPALTPLIVEEVVPNLEQLARLAANMDTSVANEILMAQIEVAMTQDTEQNYFNIMPAVPTSPPSLFKYAFQGSFSEARSNILRLVSEEFDENQQLPTNGPTGSPTDQLGIEAGAEVWTEPQSPIDRNVAIPIVSVRNTGARFSNSAPPFNSAPSSKIEKLEAEENSAHSLQKSRAGDITPFGDLAHFRGSNWNVDFASFTNGFDNSMLMSTENSVFGADNEGNAESANLETGAEAVVGARQTLTRTQSDHDFVSLVPGLAELYGQKTPSALLKRRSQHTNADKGVSDKGAAEKGDTANHGRNVSEHEAGKVNVSGDEYSYPIVIGKKTTLEAVPKDHTQPPIPQEAFRKSAPYLIRSSSDSEFVLPHYRHAAISNVPKRGAGDAGDLEKPLIPDKRPQMVASGRIKPSTPAVVHVLPIKSMNYTDFNLNKDCTKVEKKAYVPNAHQTRACTADGKKSTNYSRNREGNARGDLFVGSPRSEFPVDGQAASPRTAPIIGRSPRAAKYHLRELSSFNSLGRTSPLMNFSDSLNDGNFPRQTGSSSLGVPSQTLGEGTLSTIGSLHHAALSARARSPDLDRDVDGGWKEWQLQQYQIWEDKLCLGENISDKLPTVTSADSPSAANSPQPRPFTSPAAAAVHTNNNTINLIVASPPITPKPSSVSRPSTSGGSAYIRAKVVIPTSRPTSSAAICKANNHGNDNDDLEPHYSHPIGIGASPIPGPNLHRVGSADEADLSSEEDGAEDDMPAPHTAPGSLETINNANTISSNAEGIDKPKSVKKRKKIKRRLGSPGRKKKSKAPQPSTDGRACTVPGLLPGGNPPVRFVIRNSLKDPDNSRGDRLAKSAGLALEPATRQRYATRRQEESDKFPLASLIAQGEVVVVPEAGDTFWGGGSAVLAELESIDSFQSMLSEDSILLISEKSPPPPDPFPRLPHPMDCGGAPNKGTALHRGHVRRLRIPGRHYAGEHAGGKPSSAREAVRVPVKTLEL